MQTGSLTFIKRWNVTDCYFTPVKHAVMVLLTLVELVPQRALKPCKETNWGTSTHRTQSTQCSLNTCNTDGCSKLRIGTNVFPSVSPPRFGFIMYTEECPGIEHGNAPRCFYECTNNSIDPVQQDRNESRNDSDSKPWLISSFNNKVWFVPHIRSGTTAPVRQQHWLVSTGKVQQRTKWSVLQVQHNSILNFNFYISLTLKPLRNQLTSETIWLVDVFLFSSPSPPTREWHNEVLQFKNSVLNWEFLHRCSSCIIAYSSEHVAVSKT